MASPILHSTTSCVSLCLLQVLKLLLAAGANVDGRKHFEGLTALHLAAISGSAEVVHSLLDNGADPAPRDCNGHTAAELARIFGREELVAILASCPSKEVSLSTAPRSLELKTIGILKRRQRTVST